MGKREVIGKCRICGEIGKLTFEHVPPHAANNRRPIIERSLLDCVSEDEKNGSLPWEKKNSNGRINQKGLGGYYLCEKCNNSTGSWYANDYKTFVNTLICVLLESKRNNEDRRISIKLMEMYPLRILKQIMTMFCDINPNLASNDPSLRDFILNRENNTFNSSKYRIYMYIMRSGFMRVCNLCHLILKNYPCPIMVSEVSNIPVGFLLYLDKPDDIIINECEISSFSAYSYNDKRSIELIVNIHDNNSYMIADFRSKSDIKKSVSKTAKNDEDHESIDGIS